MASPYTYNNEGAGSLIITMDNDETADMDFTQADLDAGLCACVVSGNNEVGMGADTYRLFGKVVAVSEELDSSSRPIHVSVQVKGVARFMYVAVTPVVGQEVEVDGAGKVTLATAEVSYPAGGHSGAGVCIAVDTTATTCDVLL